ncbi:unnamed protein product [Cylicostephanus goldi]|uniref:Uncharacterized protein n=1 Tax=Cylicostephanus goldi TaxID=71465 RepID=A0A3P7MGG7_CYLGO|nr:unnamed protein product [Cylicostephanus goldi]
MFYPDRAPVAPLLGTPDSRITSFEGGTTKSCATIPEDDEEESPSCEKIDDLVSIDRTTTSTSEQKSRQCYNSHSSYNLVLPVSPPEFQIPVPLYSPPSVPSNPSRPSQTSRNGTHGSPEEPSPSLQSIGSIHLDSHSVRADLERLEWRWIDDGMALSRIEEESEGYEERAMRTVFSQGSLDREQNFVIPRSISEQFELMRRN